MLLTAQLVDAASDTHLWSQAYPADMSNLQSLFDIQAEIANSLRVAFFEEERDQIEQISTQSRAAYEIVLKARQESSVSGVSRLPQLLELYQEAVTIDPTFADAWVELARAVSLWAIYAPPEDVESIVAQRDEAVSRALEANPQLPAAHIARGDFLLAERDWAGAALAYDRARRFSPPDTQACIGERLLVALGRKTAQVLECRPAAVRADPLSGLASQALQRILDVLGQGDEAAAEYSRILPHANIRGGREYHALMRARRKGDAEEIDAQLVQFLRSTTQSVPELDQVVFVADDPDAVVALLRPLLDDPDYRGGVAIATIATFLAHYDDPVGAVEALRRLYLEEIGYEPIFPWLPVYSEARRTPEFKTFVRDLGMVGYWSATGEWSEFCQPIGAENFECF